MDSFELFYTFLIFPVYWFLMIVELIFLFIVPKQVESGLFEDILDKE